MPSIGLSTYLYLNHFYLSSFILMSYLKASHGAWPANGYFKSSRGKSLYKKSCSGKGTFILDYIQTVLKEWNRTKRERLFLLPVSPLSGKSFHLAHFFFIGTFTPASIALQNCCDFTQMWVFHLLQKECAAALLGIGLLGDMF